MTWILDLLAGVLLSLLFYALVRVRMKLAPKMNDHFGAWARWSTWAVITILMVIAANVVLGILRNVLHESYDIDQSIFHELLFALVALAGGYYLVTRYVTRDRHN